MKHKCDGCGYKGVHQELMFKPFGVYLREPDLLEAEKNYRAGKCPYQMTNGDRIRAMSDEELAKFFDCFDSCAICPEAERLNDNPLLRNEKCDEDCVTHVLKWLKQPVEVET